MNLPFFARGTDPGPDFAALMRSRGTDPFAAVVPEIPHSPHQITHGTTCVAVRYVDGVVMAGDRRATSGNLISHRSIEKVFPADRHSAVAIAGAAGPAVEMVRLFQLQLEHYEKVEGAPLSLEGKANQLGQFLKSNLPAAMSGLAVVPIFAGFDLTRETGRLFEYDITGGRYEESDYAATGSGSLHAETVIKVGYRRAMTQEDAVGLVSQALFQAADADSATGGADTLRGIFPVVVTVTADGFTRVDDSAISDHFATIAQEFSDNHREAGA
ncbi:MAG: proteasome subunit beta [Acidimicrobiales bacterium]